MPDNKKNVLMVHNFYQIPGGEDSVFRNEKRLLSEHGHKVFEYTRNNSEISSYGVLKKIMLPLTSVFSFKTFKEVSAVIKKEHIDVVHVHNTLSLVSPSVYYAAFKNGVPVVQTVHNFRFLCPSAVFQRGGRICEDCVKKSLFCSVKNKCYRNSFAQTFVSAAVLKIHRLLGTYKKVNFICLTEFNKEKLLGLNKGGKTIIDEKKVFIKPNFTYIDNEGSFDKKNQFVFAGRLEKIKGIELLFNAWKDIKSADLVVCGSGPLEDWCHDFILKNNLKNIKMKGFVSQKEAGETIARSKALIMPSQWYEGFPMSMVESWALNTPVIGSDIGNVGALISNGVNGITFKHDSCVALKKAVLDFDKYRFDAYGYYKEHYEPKKNYSLLSDIYSKIIR